MSRFVCTEIQHIHTTVHFFHDKVLRGFNILKTMILYVWRHTLMSATRLHDIILFIQRNEPTLVGPGTSSNPFYCLQYLVYFAQVFKITKQHFMTLTRRIHRAGHATPIPEISQEDLEAIQFTPDRIDYVI